jgi:phosphatidylglycerol---prolipoprotein diacylglyceryl transferase
MYPKLLHIYGPLYLQSYGLCIALGLTVFAWLLYRDKRRRQIMNDDQFHTLILIGAISGIVGGRILYFMTEVPIHQFYQFFEFWQGGFAVLGSVLGVLLVIPWCLKKYNLPGLPLLDRVALYGPLLQGISRIGCFLAGCCYGKQTLLPWAITYSNPECMAPLGIALHPTQLYSALFL